MYRSFALAVLLAGSSANAANLIVNPGFESAPAAVGGYDQYYGGGSFVGWNVVGDQMIVIDTDYTDGTIHTNSHSGRNSADLTGVGTGAATTGIHQDIATVTGQTYRVSFWVGNLSSDGPDAGAFSDPTTVDLSINGGSRVSFTHGGITQNFNDYAQFTSSFVAVGPSTNIAFFRGIVADNNVALDDIKVSAVPEPASWTLMIGGFGLVGGIMRRRNAALA